MQKGPKQDEFAYLETWSQNALAQEIAALTRAEAACKRQMDDLKKKRQRIETILAERSP